MPSTVPFSQSVFRVVSSGKQSGAHESGLIYPADVHPAPSNNLCRKPGKGGISLTAVIR